MDKKLKFQKAVKHESKLRLAIAGPAGSGKTYTALEVASYLTSKPIALVDTEHGSASKYADIFSFDTVNLEPPFTTQNFLDAIVEAELSGYGVIILDSLSHAWSGTGGLLDEVQAETQRQKTSNSYTAWAKVTPIYNKLVDGIIRSDIHVIATFRSKQDYILETDGNGKSKPRKVGMAPIIREGMEFEFDVWLDMDHSHVGVVTKTRCTPLTDAVIEKPGEDLAATLLAWLSGEAAPVMALEDALNVLSPKGHKFSELTTDQVAQVLRSNSAAFTAEMRQAARVILQNNGASERASQVT